MRVTNIEYRKPKEGEWQCRKIHKVSADYATDPYGELIDKSINM